ncbi:hypothetical protein [Xanthomonas sp. 3075]|uniref:hypothetical protein n=1 Tax=Xanthomonas sp. 3075 TaxID=3035315 RepID=UPI001620B22E|nr:hypothetical protein [Xanthomonas sp. 3075]MBB4130816.1 hypothetical protein [Xanthomonas sp. 3075]
MTDVRAVLEQQVHVVCERGDMSAQLRAHGTDAKDGVRLPFHSHQELAEIFSLLQSLQIPFTDTPAGWPPAAVFAQLRDQGLVQGAITTIAWTRPDTAVFGIG